MKNNYVAITPANGNSQPSGMVITLESTGIFFAILVAIVSLLSATFSIISKFNRISNSIKEFDKNLENHISTEGHQKLIEEIEKLEINIQTLDKKLDLHIQDYLHHRDLQKLLQYRQEKQ